MINLIRCLSTGSLLLTVTSVLAATCPTNKLSISTFCNAQEQTLPCNVTIKENSSISKAVFECDATNHGWISNSTIKSGATVTGGILTGFIQNEGILKDIDFRGISINGGTLAGNITISARLTAQGFGRLKNVQLAAGTYLSGGQLEGVISGDKNNPAVLENVVIKSGTHLSGIQLGDNVQLGKDVVIDEESPPATDEEQPTPAEEAQFLKIRYPRARDNVEDYWNQFDWVDLTVDEQELWTQLGWDAASWQGDAAAPASENLSWLELSEAERAIAKQLCYNQLAWDFTEVRRPLFDEVTIEAFWNSFTWDQLTDDEQALWTQLGWNSTNWQSETAAKNLLWDELSEDEQAAATQLGYPALSWAVPQIRYPQIGDNVEDYWNRFNWNDLNEAEQALWAQLGWNEANWDGEAEVPTSEEQDWEQLSEAERNTAVQLNYNQYTWNLVPEEIEAYWNSFAWSELTDLEQALWDQLGWNEANWDGEEAEAPISESKYWIYLTKEERAIAAQLGYDQMTWDALDIRQPEAGEDLEAFWNGFAWTDLNANERFLWGQLGWNEANWEGNAKEPTSENKDWEELTVAERAAATQLGYTQTYWDSL